MGDVAALEPQWRALEENADGSFFLSWSWIGTWLQSLKAPCLLLRIRDGAETAGLAVLVPRTVRRHAVVRSRQWHLNAAGDPDLDRLAIEYNGVLLRRGLGPDVLAALFAFLRDQAGWQECVLPGVSRGFVESARAAGLDCVIDHAAPDFAIDLAALKAAGGEVMATLSANSRGQLRRALRLAEAQGALTLTPARDAAQAQEFLGHLQNLDRRGGQGAFSTPARQAFHRRLLAVAVPRGEAELIAVTAGEIPFGYLYNFLYRGRVLSYQTGWQRGPDNRHHPGLVMHYLAIGRAMRAGFQVYDFLAGEARYKRSLAAPGEALLWCRLQQPRLLFHLERAGRFLRGCLS